MISRDKSYNNSLEVKLLHSLKILLYKEGGSAWYLYNLDT